MNMGFRGLTFEATLKAFSPYGPGYRGLTFDKSMQAFSPSREILGTTENSIMKLKTKLCYSHLVHLMLSGEEYYSAVATTNIIRGPAFDTEGIAGYIETEVEFGIKDISRFAKIWDSWYSLSLEQRNKYYGMAKGLHNY